MIPPVQIESNCFYTNILTARNEINNCSRVAVQLLTMCLRALYINDWAVQANYSTRATHEAQGFQSVWKLGRKLCAVTGATHTSKCQFIFSIIGPPTPLSFKMTAYHYVAVGKGEA